MSGVMDVINTFTRSTVNSFDPVTAGMTGLQQTLTSLGGGLGSVILSIPGIGKPTVDALAALQRRAKEALANARSMTPEKIKEENDSINRDYEKLLDEAKKKGEAEPPPPQNKFQETQSLIGKFFSNVFSNTLYIGIFIIVIILGLLGSSLAANSIGVGMPFGYYIYYMIYGFLLFPLSIVLAVYNYYIKGKRPLFYSVWAPIYKGNYTGIFQYNLVSTDIVHYVSESTAKPLPTNTYETSGVSQRSLISQPTISKPRAVFEPTSV